MLTWTFTAWKPSWLEGTNLTRFDVPGLAQLIWSPGFDNRGILCDDVQMPASCILGGGTAINAGQFYLVGDLLYECGHSTKKIAANER